MNIDNSININKSDLIKKKEYPTLKAPKILTTEDLIHRLWNTDSENLKKFLAEEAVPIKLESSNFNAYKDTNLLLVRSNGANAYNLENDIKFLEQFSFSPKYKKWLKIGDDDYISILELDKNNVLPYQQVASIISEETKQKFKNDIRALAEKGLMISSAFTNREALFVTKDKKKIILADVANIKRISDTDKPQLLENIKNWKF